MSTVPKQENGFITFIKGISMRTWIIGAFVVLFLIWFIPKIGTFAKIAGALGMAAALGFLAPVLLPLITALLGGLAAVVATGIASMKKALDNGKTTDEAKKIAEGEQEDVEKNINDNKWSGDDLKARSEAGAEAAFDSLNDETIAEDEVAEKATNPAMTNFEGE